MVFNVVEQGRKISFKKARPAVPDSLRNVPLKIKVLPGDIYETKPDTVTAGDSIREFDLTQSYVEEQPMEDGMYYSVVKETESRPDAVALVVILK